AFALGPPCAAPHRRLSPPIAHKQQDTFRSYRTALALAADLSVIRFAVAVAGSSVALIDHAGVASPHVRTHALAQAHQSAAEIRRGPCAARLGRSVSLLVYLAELPVSQS